MNKYTQQSFEDFLHDMFMKDEPMILDDDMPDAFEAWLENVGTELMIAYAEKWHTEQMLAELTN